MSKTNMNNKLEIDFEFEKETKGTVRFKEEDDGERPWIGTVYILKDKLPKPFPKKIKVTVEFLN